MVRKSLLMAESFVAFVVALWLLVRIGAAAAGCH
jgi:hypothetical protein